MKLPTTATEALLARVKELLSRTIRVGTVVSRYPAEAKVRVKFEELTSAEGRPLVSGKLKVVLRRTLRNKAYDGTPDIGEQVLCLCWPIGPEQGFVLGSLYSQVDPPPHTSGNKDWIEYPDGTVLKYDRAAHHLEADIKGSGAIKATEGLVLNAAVTVVGKLIVGDDLDVTGDVYATGTIIDESGNTNHHSH